MARKTKVGARLRWLSALLLVGLVGGTLGWWHVRHWVPERSEFPVQGVVAGSAEAPVDWRAVEAIGADFAYLEASASAFARDPAFSKNLAAARAAGLQVGAVHRYDPCQPADKQAGNFVTVVPRDPKLLPPAVELELLAENCPIRVGEAAVQSELMTFLNQVETHTGKPALLKLGRAFEKRYGIAAAIDRNVWLTGDRIEPDYAGRPWSLWTANSALPTEAGTAPLRWVVLQP